MDAERLIGVSRHALAGSTDEWDVIAEAWQAQSLARAIGVQLALNGPKELKSDARELAEGGGRDCGPPYGPPDGLSGLPDRPGPRIGRIRAGQLSGVADIRAALTGLGALLGEVGIALVAVACATDEEGMYWQCIDAIDAVDEAGDRVGVMLRRLVARDREREREWARQREERQLGLEWQRQRERESRIGRDGKGEPCPKVQDGGHGSSNLHRAPARGELRDTADRGQGLRGPGV
ncbi:hypothetical protein Y717_14360 [Streptomyces scopuliridis RB72]|uniref:Uncharacterized protein n=1 Tax=Streptomyces scopuliridis RB72 TaxID=1440053 RepID=A0A2T7SMM8_9ACTN|nr:hypothetical protein Y717_14360 [Streptomyces scopuliridis RB72]